MIRKYKTGDEKFIAALETECFSAPWSEQAITDSAKNGTLFFVYENEGEIIGYAGLDIVLDEGYVTNIAVCKKARRQGIGKALTQKLCLEAQDKNLCFISLEVRSQNKAAIALYEGEGFIAEGCRKNFYANPTDDAIIMTKRFKEVK